MSAFQKQMKDTEKRGGIHNESFRIKEDTDHIREQVIYNYDVNNSPNF